MEDTPKMEVVHCEMKNQHLKSSINVKNRLNQANADFESSVKQDAKRWVLALLGCADVELVDGVFDFDVGWGVAAGEGVALGRVDGQHQVSWHGWWTGHVQQVDEAAQCQLLGDLAVSHLAQVVHVAPVLKMATPREDSSYKATK